MYDMRYLFSCLDNTKRDKLHKYKKQKITNLKIVLFIKLLLMVNNITNKIIAIKQGVITFFK